LFIRQRGVRSAAFLSFAVRMYERAVWYLLPRPVAGMREFVGSGLSTQSADVLRVHLYLSIIHGLPVSR
jgi:hypothetical protein